MFIKINQIEEKVFLIIKSITNVYINELKALAVGQ